MDPTETFGAIAAALDVAFAFDKPAETFTSFGPTRPDFLNNLAPLRYGDGFWVRMDAPATWTQPASSPPVQVTSADTSATLEIPRGALPQGMDPAELTISDGPVPVLEGGDPPVIAVQLEPSGLTFPAPIFLSAPVALGPGEMPIPVLLSQERGVEFVPGATIDSDRDDLGRVIVNFPIDHFSVAAIYAGAPAMFSVQPIPVGEVTIGDEFFFAEAIFTRLDFEFEVTITTPDEFILPPEGTAKQIVRIRPELMRGFWAILLDRFEVQIGSVREVAFNLFASNASVARSTLTDSERWLCEAPPGPFSLRVSGKGINPTTLRTISVAEDGDILADKTFEGSTEQERPVALIAGTCIAPVIPAIVAVLTAPITTYTVDIPADAGIHFLWSGWDCGSVTGSTSNTMVWNHGEEGCEHAGEAHPSTQIALLVASDAFEIRCTYLSAASGTGPPCEQTG